MRIRTRQHEATIEHESDRAGGRQPNTYTLPLGSARMYYTVERQEIVIRGYGWAVVGEAIDDFDDYYYSEFEWSLPTDAK